MPKLLMMFLIFTIKLKLMGFSWAIAWAKRFKKPAIPYISMTLTDDRVRKICFRF